LECAETGDPDLIDFFFVLGDSFEAVGRFEIVEFAQRYN
jgi:hypothetical protein